MNPTRALLSSSLIRKPALLPAVALISLTTPSLIAAPVYWTSATTGTWSAATWTPGGAPPGSGDDAVFGLPSPGVAIATGTFNIDSDPVLGSLVLQDNLPSGGTATNWTFQGLTSARTLTLNSGITYNALSNHTINSTNLSVILGGNNIWNIDKNLNATPQGSAFTGLTVNANISGAFNITKSGGRALTLSGNNTFNGLIIKRQTVFLTGAAANTVLGSGSVTFANDATGANVEANGISINSGAGRTYANNFINSNAHGSQTASITLGQSSGRFVSNFAGDFSTSGLNAAQFLTLGASGNTNGTSEHVFAFSGSWANYTAGPSDAIRISGGAVRLDNIASVAPVNYAITSADAGVSGKLIFNFASSQTVNQKMSFTGAVNSMRNSLGTSSTTGITTTLAGSGGTAITLTDNDGGNLFSLNTGAIFAISGNITGASTGKVRINDGFPLSSGTGASASALQLPTGTVSLSGTGNAFTGGVDVMRGTLIAANASGNATGTGAITIGAAGAVVTATASTGAVASRVVTGVSNAAALTMAIGQTVTGTGIPGGSVITGITNGATATVSISNALTVANPALTTTAYTAPAILQLGNNDATGSLDPAASITINTGSTFKINRSDAAIQGTHFSTAAITGAGGVEQAGSGTTTLNVDNSYTGATNVTAGKLVVNANISTSSLVSVSSGATLGGSGTLGSASVNGTLAIGNSAGTMNFSSLALGSGSTFLYEMTGGGVTADLGDISGTLSIDPSSILDLVELGTYTAGNKFTLFAYDGALTGTFNGLANNSTFLDDLSNPWQIKYDDPTAGLNGGVSASNTFVTITAIPEPGAAMLLGGLGLLGLLRRRVG